MTKEWTPRELDILRSEFPVKPTAEVAAMLGRTERSVAVKACKIGIKKTHYGTLWTPRMLKMLTDFYPIMFNRPLAKWIGVSPSSLHRKARALGLTKRPGFLEDRRQEIHAMAAESLRRTKKTGGRIQPGQHHSRATEFKPGHQATEEEKAKRLETMRRNKARRAQRDELKHYGIGVNR